MKARRTTRSSPRFKGSYPESMTAAIAAFPRGQRSAPAAGVRSRTATMMAAKGAIVPVAHGHGERQGAVHPKAYLPTSRAITPT